MWKVQYDGTAVNGGRMNVRSVLTLLLLLLVPAVALVCSLPAHAQSSRALFQAPDDRGDDPAERENARRTEASMVASASASQPAGFALQLPAKPTAGFSLSLRDLAWFDYYYADCANNLPNASYLTIFTAPVIVGAQGAIEINYQGQAELSEYTQPTLANGRDSIIISCTVDGTTSCNGSGIALIRHASANYNSLTNLYSYPSNLNAITYSTFVSGLTPGPHVVTIGFKRNRSYTLTFAQVCANQLFVRY